LPLSRTHSAAEQAVTPTHLAETLLRCDMSSRDQTKAGQMQRFFNLIRDNLENWFEATLFASRWLLAPFYLGLAVGLLTLLIKFGKELVHVIVLAFTGTEADVILGVLSLVDLSLTGSLLIIVIFSGYENFVSKIDHTNHQDWPEWMGKIDFTALKLKLLSSIVAISAIQLLRQFMDVKATSDRDLMWSVTIHIVFVVSSVFLALSDYIAGKTPKHDSPATTKSGSTDNGHAPPGA
jgi:uncharacterized protein (TIGR00645 family)